MTKRTTVVTKILDRLPPFKNEDQNQTAYTQGWNDCLKQVIDRILFVDKEE